MSHNNSDKLLVLCMFSYVQNTNMIIIGSTYGESLEVAPNDLRT